MATTSSRRISDASSNVDQPQQEQQFNQDQLPLFADNQHSDDATYMQMSSPPSTAALLSDENNSNSHLVSTNRNDSADEDDNSVGEGQVSVINTRRLSSSLFPADSDDLKELIGSIRPSNVL